MQAAIVMSARRLIWLFLSLASIPQVWAIDTMDENPSNRLAVETDQTRSSDGIAGKPTQEMPGTCTPFGNPDRTDNISKYEIRKSGYYCLTESLHARIDMADHSAEATLIVIRASNVVVDLQGHTLGRGLIFKNPGGIGILIVDPYRYAGGVGNAKDIVIRNGVLQDFKTGIEYGALRSPPDAPSFDPATNTYRFPASNITLENITFKNNKKDFNIRVPPEPKK